MSITLYTAPDCLRCKIVKGFLAEHQIAYETVDFKADAQTFNTFYRAYRCAILSFDLMHHSINSNIRFSFLFCNILFPLKLI